MNSFYENFIEDLQNNKKVLKKASTAKQSTLNKYLTENKADPSSKINKILQFINILRDHYIIRRISDVDKDIRKSICDTITKLSKHSFTEVFTGKLPNYYKFFLSDSFDSIKVRYLGILYERIEKNEKEEEEIVMKILKDSRKIIINLCLKDNNKLAKPAIRIIEILSEMKLLTEETVNSLLPHLFNSETSIRNLISRVVLNTILNFSKKQDSQRHSEIKDEEMEEEEEFTFDNFVEVIEFFFKLSANEPNMISILVNNFYSSSNFLLHFDFYFRLLSILLNQEKDEQIEVTQPHTSLITTVIRTLNFTVKELQKKIEEMIERDLKLVSKNEEFVNLMFINLHNMMNCLMIDDIENFNELLNLFESFKIYDQSLVKFEEKNFLEILKSLQKAFILNYTIEKIKLESYESLMEKLLKATQLLKNNETLIAINKEYKKNFEKLSLSLNESFINLYQSEVSQTSSSQSTPKFEKTYMILIQFYSLLKYNNLSSSTFKISDALTNIIDILKVVAKNFVLLSEKYQTGLIERVMLTCLNIANEIVFCEFNKLLRSHLLANADLNLKNQKLEEFVKNRNNLFLFIQSLIQQSDVEDKFLNFSLLRVKTRAACIMLEIFIYSASEKLKDSHSLNTLYYPIPSMTTELLQSFMKKNFIPFLDEFSSNLTEKNEEPLDEDEDKQAQDSDNEVEKDTEKMKENQQDNQDEEARRKAKNEDFGYIFVNFKHLCESFSKLLVLNLGIFKHKELCTLYFECFLLLKMPVVIKNITKIVFERIYEKELENYKSQVEISKVDSNPLNIILYYVTKVSMRVYNEKSSLYNYRTFSFEERKEMISRLWTPYAQCLKDFKIKKKENVMNKDKLFYTNFIFNCLVTAFESPENIKEGEKIVIRLKNVQLLDIICLYFKPKTYFEEKDYKQLLVSLIKMTEEVSSTEKNLVYNDIKTIERLKKDLVKKAKLYKFDFGEAEKDKSNQPIKEEIGEDEDKENEMKDDGPDSKKEELMKEEKEEKTSTIKRRRARNKRTIHQSGLKNEHNKKMKLN